MPKLLPPKISLLIINEGTVHVQHIINVVWISAKGEGLKVSVAGDVSIVFGKFITKYNP
jgi:hypothetical protein